jgi:hypothetical protein
MEQIPIIQSANCTTLLLNTLIQCCKEELVDLNALINCLLSLINSRKTNSIFCIDTITQLMLIYPDYPHQKHPFIDIWRNRASQFDNLDEIVYQQIERVYSSDLTSQKCTEILRPVFVEIFLDPSSTFKHSIASFLIEKLVTIKDDENEHVLIIGLVRLYFRCLKNSEMASLFFRQPFNDLITLICSSKSANVKKVFDGDIFGLLFAVDLLIRLDKMFSYGQIDQWVKLKMLISKVNVKIYSISLNF